MFVSSPGLCDEMNITSTDVKISIYFPILHLNRIWGCMYTYLTITSSTPSFPT
jgi:hypothetical protein